MTHAFVCAWIRQDTEAENVRVNGALMKNVLDALSGNGTLRHAALVTGTKQYLGAFESYGQTNAETPFREDNPRLPGLNFYYRQEDLLFEAAARDGFSWSVHRRHTIIGFAVGNAMNSGVTLAVYASLCRARGEPFVFPGSNAQWNALTDVTDATLLAEHLEWASTTPAAGNEAFNVVNGDVFRWRWMWTQRASFFGLEAEGPPAGGAPLAARLENADAEWRALAAANGLLEPDLDRLTSAWHTDADLGLDIECVNDMSKSRRFGFSGHRETPQCFFALFERLRRERLIPS